MTSWPESSSTSSRAGRIALVHTEVAPATKGRASAPRWPASRSTTRGGAGFGSSPAAPTCGPTWPSTPRTTTSSSIGHGRRLTRLGRAASARQPLPFDPAAAIPPTVPGQAIQAAGEDVEPVGPPARCGHVADQLAAQRLPRMPARRHPSSDPRAGRLRGRRRPPSDPRPRRSPLAARPAGRRATLARTSRRHRRPGARGRRRRRARSGRCDPVPRRPRPARPSPRPPRSSTVSVRPTSAERNGASVTSRRTKVISRSVAAVRSSACVVATAMRAASASG